jgi:hypothetical protein
MKKLALFLAVSISLTLTAVTTTSAQSGPRVYIMMKDGKLTEVMDGKQEPVKQDITLPNKSTIHPDGSIDDKDGNKKKLNEGEYITMDGRVRLLKNMAGAARPATTTATAKTTTAKPAAKH